MRGAVGVAVNHILEKWVLAGGTTFAEIPANEIQRLRKLPVKQYLILDVLRFSNTTEIIAAFNAIQQRHWIAVASTAISRYTVPILIIADDSTTNYYDWHIIHNCTTDRGMCKCWYNRWLFQSVLKPRIGRNIRKSCEHGWDQWLRTIEYYSSEERRVTYFLDKSVAGGLLFRLQVIQDERCSNPRRQESRSREEALVRVKSAISSQHAINIHKCFSDLQQSIIETGDTKQAPKWTKSKE